MSNFTIKEKTEIEPIHIHEKVSIVAGENATGKISQGTKNLMLHNCPAGYAGTVTVNIVIQVKKVI